jgi:DNA-binding winged helix-turn-helix (wHTH) protein
MRLSFGGLTLDSETRQLLRRGEAVPLSPKAFDLLSHLVEHRPRALSKDELHDRLWPGTYVSETNLAGLVAEIRRALEDDARTPRFVRTVHRFGYAFAGAVDRTSSQPARASVRSRFWLAAGKRRIVLNEGENVLGREPEAGGFDSTAVSRRHARIVIDGGEAYLEDLGSKNGTFLRGRRIDSTEKLKDGDAVNLGSVEVIFHAPSDDRSTRTWKPARPR